MALLFHCDACQGCPPVNNSSQLQLVANVMTEACSTAPILAFIPSCI